MAHRTITFIRQPDGFTVREFVEGTLEAVQSMTFERAFKRMTELKNEGFALSGETRFRRYVYEKEV